MALINKLSAIGDAVRNKTGSSDLYTLDEMATAINNIQIQQPFDMNAVNQILSTICFSSPEVAYNGVTSKWPYNGNSTPQIGIRTAYGNVSYKTNINLVFELPSVVNIPEGYTLKFDYDVRWYKLDFNPYGSYYFNAYQSNLYTDETRAVITRAIQKNNADISDGNASASGTMSYNTAGTVVIDKTIKKPRFEIHFQYTSANTRADNLIYKLDNFRIEPISQGE